MAQYYLNNFFIIISATFVFWLNHLGKPNRPMASIQNNLYSFHGRTVKALALLTKILNNKF